MRLLSCFSSLFHLSRTSVKELPANSMLCESCPPVNCFVYTFHPHSLAVVLHIGVTVDVFFVGGEFRLRTLLCVCLLVSYLYVVSIGE